MKAATVLDAATAAPLSLPARLLDYAELIRLRIAVLVLFTVAAGAMLAVQGLGFALFSSPNMTMIMNSVARERASTASAFSAMARNFGMLCGMVITSVAISLSIGSAPVSGDPLAFVPVMTTMFIVLAVLNLAALAISLTGQGHKPA